MNLSRKWLSEFTAVDAGDKDFAEAMTLSGSKVELTHDLGGEISNVVVGRVLSLVRHENSDHMWVCQVDVGSGEPVQIVTGAQNVKQGDLVPVAKHKSTLPGGVKIEKGKLRGVVSNGMLCSFQELGLEQRDFPAAYEDGIWILSDDPELSGLIPGQDIRTAVGLDDHVVEFEITPNRPDCLSVIGLAREAAATFDQPLHLHTPVVKGGGAGELSQLLDVETPDPELCPRYTARMVRNVKIAPSPKWMRERLRSMSKFVANTFVNGRSSNDLSSSRWHLPLAFSRPGGGRAVLPIAGAFYEWQTPAVVWPDYGCGRRDRGQGFVPWRGRDSGCLRNLVFEIQVNGNSLLLLNGINISIKRRILGIFYFNNYLAIAQADISAGMGNHRGSFETVYPERSRFQGIKNEGDFLAVSS